MQCSETTRKNSIYELCDNGGQDHWIKSIRRGSVWETSTGELTLSLCSFPAAQEKNVSAFSDECRPM